MRKIPVAVLISGNGSNLQALIDACVESDYPASIALVVSNKAEAFGLQRAKKAGIPTRVISHTDFSSREVFDDAMHAKLVSAGVQIVCLAGFMRLLSSAFVEKWQGRMLNIHPSLLPEFKGLDTHARAIEAGVAEAGCSVHLVTAELDGGPVLLQARVPVLANDTAKTLAARVLKEEHRIYPLALRKRAEDLRGS